MIDLTNERFLPNRYGGSEKKRTLIYNDRIYMVKFPDPIREKGNDLSYMNNAYSEYIGCKIMESLDIRAQNTFLAKYREKNGKEKVVVACEDFCQDGAVLSEFSKLILEDTDNEFRIAKKTIPIELIMNAIDGITGLADPAQCKNRFWDLFVADTLIGNGDRHLDNWGLLLKDKKLEFSPIYDCGSALSPLLSDNVMRIKLNDEDLFRDSEYNIMMPYSYEDKRIFCPKFYESPPIQLREAVKRIVPRINEKKIADIIESAEGISRLRQDYINNAIAYRLEHILNKSLKRIQNEEANATRMKMKNLFCDSHSGSHIQNEKLRMEWERHLEKVVDKIIRIPTEKSREEAFTEEMRKRLKENFSDAEINAVLNISKKVQR